MDYKPKQPVKDTIRPVPKQDPFLKERQLQKPVFYFNDVNKEPSECSVIQRARKDRKKEKWKEGRGKLNWKHGRKQKSDMKHQVFGEDTDLDDLGDIETIPYPIVSGIMRQNNFNEINYVAPGSLLVSLYLDTDSTNDLGLRKSIIKLRPNFDLNAEFDVVSDTLQEIGEEILEISPELKARITSTGNCGTLATFLYGDTISSKNEDFDKFINKLEQDVPADRVKLIRVAFNIGHTITLICYKQYNETVVELIQAWQDQYSVKKSLNKAKRNIYINHDLADKFRTMHNNIKSRQGKAYFKRIFLGAKLKDDKNKLNKLEITHLNDQILEEKPDQYARRISSKKLK